MYFIFNLFSSQTRGYVSDEILHAESEEGLEKIQDAIKVCHSYKELYHDRRNNLAQYFKGATPVVEWSYEPSLVFARMDRFLKQLITIEVRDRDACCRQF